MIPEKISSLSNLENILDDQDFQNHCLILTCLSLLLEIFGHVFISLATTTAYLLYFLEPKFMVLVCHLAQWSDVGGLMFGKLFGKHPFA